MSAYTSNLERDLDTRVFVALFVEIPYIIRVIRRKQSNYIPKYLETRVLVALFVEIPYIIRVIRRKQSN
jgi:hypothetical protein